MLQNKETKETASEEKGQAQEQPSDSSETTAPQGDAKIDPAKEYVINKNGDTMLGGDILNQMGRGRLAQEIQSKSDKQAAEMEKMQKQLSIFQAEKAERENRERIENLLKERGISNLAPTVTKETNTDTWFTEEEETPAQPDIDMEKIARRIEAVSGKVTKENLGDVKTLVKELVAEELNTQEAERDKNTHVKRAFETARGVRFDKLKDELGLDDGATNRILDLQDAAKYREIEARSLFESDQPAAANEKIQEAMSYEDTAASLRANAIVEKRESDKIREAELAIESGIMPGIKDAKPEERKTNWTRAEIQKARSDAVKEAIEAQKAYDKHLKNLAEAKRARG
jgi:hypothetical protein